MNKLIMTALSAFFLILIITNASAYHAGASLSERWFYQEDIVGGTRGFSLIHTSTIPPATFDGFAPHDWSYSASPYARIAYTYNRDAALSQAFRTFQADSQLVLKQRRDLGRRYYGSFSYYRPYRYYW